MSVNILKTLDTANYPWCSSAVMFSVSGGRAALKTVGSDFDEDYRYINRLTLNGVPLTQAVLPICSTCCGTLAAGYGIENVDCKELSRLRDRVNEEYSDIFTSAELLKPLLGLLEDGLYVLADVPHYPTDGEGRYFYDIPSESRRFDALCDGYYFGDMLSIAEHFPKYLYPTQSDTLLDERRVEHYMEVLRSSKEPPRAIAYHLYGFMSALIDGHHKAVAAARLGMPISCLTIIGSSFCTEYLYSLPQNRRDRAQFATLRVPAEEIEGYDSFRSMAESSVHPTAEEMSVLSDRFTCSRTVPEGFDTEAYPTVRELAGLYAAGLENAEITDGLIEQLLNGDKESRAQLKYLLLYLKYTDRERAMRIAERAFGDSGVIFEK